MNLDMKTKREYIRIATSYYKLGMKQDEIAKKLNISRQKVNRVLKQCLDLGIVRITIEDDDTNNLEIEMELEKLCGLKETVVIDKVSDIYEDIGKGAVSYFKRSIKDNDVIGLTRGRTIMALLDNLDGIGAKDLSVCQLAGGTNYLETCMNYDSIIHKASDILNARPFFLHAPTVLDSPNLKASLLEEESFKSTYRVLTSCTVAVVGIGKIYETHDKTRRNRIADDDYQAILGRNAVGEICARHFDIQGNLVNGEVDNKIMGIEPVDFKKIPLRIGLVGGYEKLPAVIGAIRGGFINVLIIDKKTACKLLEEFKAV